MNSSSNKTAYNIGGGIIGILLATCAIFGLIHSQSDSQPQKYQAKISYEG